MVIVYSVCSEIPRSCSSTPPPPPPPAGVCPERIPPAPPPPTTNNLIVPTIDEEPDIPYGPYGLEDAKDDPKP
jgi:hypothetical protein